MTLTATVTATRPYLGGHSGTLPSSLRRPRTRPDALRRTTDPCAGVQILVGAPPKSLVPQGQFRVPDALGSGKPIRFCNLLGNLPAAFPSFRQHVSSEFNLRAVTPGALQQVEGACGSQMQAVIGLQKPVSPEPDPGARPVRAMHA